MLPLVIMRFLVAAALVLVTACGGDDDSASGGASGSPGAGSAGVAGASGDSGQAGAGAGGLSGGGSSGISGQAGSAGLSGSGGSSGSAGASAGSGGTPGSAGGPGGAGGNGSGGGAAFVLPPTATRWDYQIGVAYPPPAGVGIVSRDRQASPAAGLYSICYVNGFQAQPSENDFWLTQHPDLILRDQDGNPVIDADWNEMLLDVHTPAKRAGIAAIVGDWIAGCQAAGFAAVEIDNLDSYIRSGGRLTEDDAVAMEKLFADAAHAHGLAIGQKNGAEMVPRRAEMGTDFAVVESCNQYDECDLYSDGYGAHVLVVEYTKKSFTTACAASVKLPTVLRDQDLVGPTDKAYVYEQCP